MPDLTDDDLTELRRLHEAATPGPWPAVAITGLPDTDTEGICLDFTVPGNGFDFRLFTDADTALILAMRNALPGLLAEVERRRAAAPDDTAPEQGEDGRELITTAALTREVVLRTVRAALVDDAGMPATWFPGEGDYVTKVVTNAVMALLPEPAPPLWTGVTREAVEPGHSLISPDPWPVPPGTAVEVRRVNATGDG